MVSDDEKGRKEWQRRSLYDGKIVKMAKVAKSVSCANLHYTQRK